MNDPENSNHLISRCSSDRSRDLKADFLTYTRRIRELRPFDKYSGCFDCFLPYSLCRKWTSIGGPRNYRRDYREKDCSYPDFTLGFFLASHNDFNYNVTYSERLKEEEIDESDLDSILKYLGKKIDIGDIETNRLFLELTLGLRPFLELLE